MKEEERVLTLDDYEYGAVVNALNKLRNDLIQEKRPTPDTVDELLLKIIDAPAKKQKRRNQHESR